MIELSLICNTKHWPVRLNKVSKIINSIMNFKNELKFNKKINYCCNIILTNDKLIKKMNYKYRKKNIPTDVLTFVSEVNSIKNKKQKICDIFLSAECIKKDASKNKISFYNHLSHLLIHSFLHINGFNHRKAKDFYIMKKKEIYILSKLQISNPYLIN
tara:strand:- start:71 stop:544 length:474 start_codon:yes stop_codon:yes gene_type:complete